MFLERQLHNFHASVNSKVGWIEVICGSMFSGKTEELIRRINRAVIAQQSVLIFKPHIDLRYDTVNVVSHNSNVVKSVPVQTSTELLAYVKNTNYSIDVIAIDEAQFFDEGLVAACVELANDGKRIIISGLDMDFTGKPFGTIPPLMCVAEFVTKLHAICMQCGELAHYSFRKNDSQETVLLGEKDLYEARCRRCFIEGNKEKALEEGWKNKEV